MVVVVVDVSGDSFSFNLLVLISLAMILFRAVCILYTMLTTFQYRRKEDLHEPH